MRPTGRLCRPSVPSTAAARAADGCADWANLRARGRDYRQFEADGMMFVISQIQIQYFRPARFDDLIRVTTYVVKAKGARVIHRYLICRGEDKLAEAETQCACLNRSGSAAT